ncbi:type I pullulanase [Alloiococcus sp. CFN-8]|uniref:type I pullulanase n=1 Tax=Alloiococcus sp. CFN-8 TaxID=3416081 RepID=UPI003CF20272
MLPKKKSPIEWKKLFDSKEFEDEYYYEGDDLGAVYSHEKTVFKLWAPTASAVTLNLYSDGNPDNKEAFLQSLSMDKSNKGVWSCEVKEDLAGIYYTYSVEVMDEVKETQDIYGRAAGVNGRRTMVVDLEKTNPEGWDEDCLRNLQHQRPVIYEVHVKDFSSDPDSGVTEKNRGKYKAFTEKNTTLKGEGKEPTCLSYIKDLGINYVHLLPVFDFQSIDESKIHEDSFNWGYDPQNYNLPEGSYSSDPFNGEVRIKEFKEMVKALHEEGIGVIMDVVYNHTFNTASAFQATVPYYYYRLNEDGSFSNGSGCGNDTASERLMFRKFIIDSVCYWAKEYHIDGFRFDLMGLHDVDTMNEIRKALDSLPGGEKLLIYGEPWQCSHSPMAEGCLPAVKDNIHLLDERIAIFSDDTRDAIKGSVFIEEDPGFINGGKDLEDKIKSAVYAHCDNNNSFIPKGPGQIISYASSHDNFTLWDKLLYTLNNGKQKLKFYEFSEGAIRLNKLAAAIYLTSLGIPFFQAGEEGARTKNGIGDSYKSPVKLNQLDWQRIYAHKSLVDYYKGLITIRKSFSVFDNRDRSIINNISFMDTGKKSVVAYVFQGSKNHKELWERLLVIYNGSEEAFSLNTGKDKYKLLLDEEGAYPEGKRIILDNEIIVPKKSAYILGLPNS